MIASRLVTSQVWLITGSQSMYGQDILDQVADQSRQNDSVTSSAG